MATEKPKKFKLGDKATLFYDAATEKKVVKGEHVEFLPEHMKSLKFKDAVQGGHLVRVDESEKEAGSDESPEVAKFIKLTNPQMIAQIKDDYELDEAEEKELDGMNKMQLIAKYKELLETAE